MGGALVKSAHSSSNGTSSVLSFSFLFLSLSLSSFLFPSSFRPFLFSTRRKIFEVGRMGRAKLDDSLAGQAGGGIFSKVSGC